MPVKEIPRAGAVTWCPLKEHPRLVAVGGRAVDPALDFYSVDFGTRSKRCELLFTCDTGKRPFTCLSWSPVTKAPERWKGTPLGSRSLLPYGVIVGAIKGLGLGFWDVGRFVEEAAKRKEMNPNETPRFSINIPKALICAVPEGDSDFKPPSPLGGGHPVSSTDPFLGGPTRFRARSIDINPLQSFRVAVGCDDGWVNIVDFDVLKPRSPSSGPPLPGAKPDPVTLSFGTICPQVNSIVQSQETHGESEITSVAWSRQADRVLASVSTSGMIAVWTLAQTKRSCITFRDPANRQRPSAVAWLRHRPLELVVAYDDDRNPSLQFWHLRNQEYPFKEVPAHHKGILSLNFNPYEAHLFLSCGKDNRTVIWAFDGTQRSNLEVFSEIVTNENQGYGCWAPHLPGVLATVSVDGEGVVSLHSAQQRRTGNITFVPDWQLKRCGVSFGFGGKVISFNKVLKEVKCNVVPSTDTDIIRHADEFEEVMNSELYESYCQQRAETAMEPNERQQWLVMRTLFLPWEERKSALVECLGFNQNELMLQIERYLGQAPMEWMEKEVHRASIQTAALSGQLMGHVVAGGDAYDVVSNGNFGPVGGPGMNLLGGFERGFPNTSTDNVDPDQFFKELEAEKDAESDTPTEKQIIAEGGAQGTGSYEGNAAGTGRGEAQHVLPLTGPQTNNVTISTTTATLNAASGSGAARAPTDQDENEFHRMPTRGSKSDACAARRKSTAGETDWNVVPDSLIKKAFLTGRKATAVALCCEAHRFADALILAADDPELWQQVKRLHLYSQRNDRFVQMVGAVLFEEWPRLISRADLQHWEEALALLVTYAPLEVFVQLAVELGRRLEQEKFDTRAAAICYLAAGDVPGASQAWSSLSSSRGHSLQKGLQDLVEKVTVLRRATGHEAVDMGVAQKVTQYAEILANSGRLVAAMRYLCLIGDSTTSSGSARSEVSSAVLKDRIFNSNPEAMIRAGIYAPLMLPFEVTQVHPQVTPAQAQMQPHQPVMHQHSLAAQVGMGGGYAVAAGVSSPPQYYNQQGGVAPKASAVTNVSPGVGSLNAQGPYGARFGAPSATSQGSLPPLAPGRVPTPTYPQRNVPIGGPPPSTRVASNPPPDAGPYGRASNQFEYSSRPSGSHQPQSQKPTGVISARPGQWGYGGAPVGRGGVDQSLSAMGGHQPSGGPMNGMSGVDPSHPGGQPGMLPSSTAPAAGATHLAPGMPTPWPIPTPIQQVKSTTTSTAASNQRVHETVGKPHGGGFPMPVAEVNYIESILSNVFNAQARNDPANVKKNEDRRQQLQKMLGHLREGDVPKATQMKLLKFIKCVEEGDYNEAEKARREVTEQWRPWMRCLRF